MTTLAERMAEAMLKKGMSQEMLAKKSGLSQPAIHKILTGQTLETRKGPQLARALDVHIDWLLEGQGPSPEDANQALSPRQRALFALFDALPKSEQEAVMADLEAKKRRYDELWEEMNEQRRGEKARIGKLTS